MQKGIHARKRPGCRAMVLNRLGTSSPQIPTSSSRCSSVRCAGSRGAMRGSAGLAGCISGNVLPPMAGRPTGRRGVVPTTVVSADVGVLGVNLDRVCLGAASGSSQCRQKDMIDAPGEVAGIGEAAPDQRTGDRHAEKKFR